MAHKAFTGRDGSMTIDGHTALKVKEWSLNATQQLVETTALGNAVRHYKPGVVSYAGSCRVLYYKDTDDNVSPNDGSTLLRNLVKTNVGATDPASVEFALRIQDDADYNEVKFKAYITNASINMSSGELVAVNVSFQVTGALTTVTV